MENFLFVGPPKLSMTSCEALLAECKLENVQLSVCTLYRPPVERIGMFCEDLDSKLGILNSKTLFELNLNSRRVFQSTFTNRGKSTKRK